VILSVCVGLRIRFLSCFCDRSNAEADMSRSQNALAFCFALFLLLYLFLLIRCFSCCYLPMTKRASRQVAIVVCVSFSWGVISGRWLCAFGANPGSLFLFLFSLRSATNASRKAEQIKKAKSRRTSQTFLLPPPHQHTRTRSS